ncbi:uncharacterized protein Dyak_GE22644, isoform C [Drosophila yakuba]|uniref:Uncharacterized protein, isoform C n=2 Tax=melanogaster subgroup TaxID=32351 RepID=A0A0R1DZQ1_DROYA|nr:uncharacterized protein Dyak_GE22644, isoform C [Drosophila yakuba]
MFTEKSIQSSVTKNLYNCLYICTYEHIIEVKVQCSKGSNCIVIRVRQTRLPNHTQKSQCASQLLSEQPKQRRLTFLFHVLTHAKTLTLATAGDKGSFSYSTMLKFLLTFGAGVYTGIYVSQNYEVPRVDDPQKLIQRFNEKLKELVDQTKNKSAGEKLVDDIKKEAKKILDD